MTIDEIKWLYYTTSKTIMTSGGSFINTALPYEEIEKNKNIAREELAKKSKEELINYILPFYTRPVNIG